MPVIFVIEDNSWGISVPKSEATAVARNDVRAAGYGMPGHYIPGNDPYAVFDIAGEAIARARAGEGPTLIEVETYRLAGHFMGDAEQYRPAGEKDALFAKDPIPKMRARVIADGHATDDEMAGIEKRAEERVADAIAFARDSKYAPDTDALTAVFV